MAFFKPLKTAWRKVNTESKYSLVGRTKPSLDKQHFPELLNKLLSALEPNQASNLQSGFRNCSVYPVNVNKLLIKFRERESYDKEALKDSFKIFLQDKFKSLESEGTNKRKKKVSVPAGKSVSIEFILVKVKSNPFLDEGLHRGNYLGTDVEDKLLKIISSDLQEAILEIEVILNDPEIKQVDVKINQSHISFRNIFNQISLKEICEEGLNSISKKGSISFENQQRSKFLLQR